MVSTRRFIWTAAFLASLVLALAAFSAAETFHIDWYTIASAGGSASAPGITLAGTAGQPAAGGLSSESYLLGAGYWGDTASTVSTPESGIYLPIVMDGFQ